MKITLTTIIVALLALLLWGMSYNPKLESNNNIFPEPIMGAFGITLGKHFDSNMVKEVLSQEQKNHTDKDRAKLSGTVLQVIPNKPNNNFQQYVIKTTQKGIIYSIEGKYQNKEMSLATCKATVKSLAGELEARHGKPRGKDSFGQWYSFRQISDNSSKSLRLYAHQCRTGAYSIIYTDEKVLKES